MIWAYVNGKIQPAHKATLSIFDRGLVLGDGLFETLRARKYRPEFLQQHYKRLARGAKKLKIALPLPEDKLGQLIYNLCKKSKISDAVVRITLTRGIYQGGLSIDPKISPSLIVTTMPVSGLNEKIYTEGVKIALSSISKEAASGLDSSIKTTNYLANIFAKAQADKKNCYEAILLGREGDIAELTTSSFFAIVNGELITPPLEAGILPGITRQIVLKAAFKKRIPVKERKIFPREIANFSEAFLTSSVRGIVPIVKIEGKTVGAGTPGSTTKLIREAYQEICNQDLKKNFDIDL